MTPSKMKDELQSLLDEQGISADQGFYSQSDIGLGIDKAIKDLLTMAARKLTEYRLKNEEKVPFLLSYLYNKISTSIPDGDQSVALPIDFFMETSVFYAPVTGRIPQICRMHTENNANISRNKYLGASDYDNTFQIKGANLEFGTVAQTPNGDYVLEYVKTPIAIDFDAPVEGVIPMPEIAHEAIVQGAYASILRKNQDNEISTIEKRKFDEQALMLVEL